MPAAQSTKHLFHPSDRRRTAFNFLSSPVSLSVFRRLACNDVQVLCTCAAMIKLRLQTPTYLRTNFLLIWSKCGFVQSTAVILVTKNSRVCSLHFRPSDFKVSSEDHKFSRRKKKELSGFTRRHLKESAIPSIFSGQLSYGQCSAMIVQ